MKTTKATEAHVSGERCTFRLPSLEPPGFSRFNLCLFGPPPPPSEIAIHRKEGAIRLAAPNRLETAPYWGKTDELRTLEERQSRGNGSQAAELGQ